MVLETTPSSVRVWNYKMSALKSFFFFLRPHNKKSVCSGLKVRAVPLCAIEYPIALQLDPLPPPFDSHLAGLTAAREPCKRAGGCQPRPSGLTLLSKTDITGGMIVDESYLPLSDVAVTFRSGQRSKWHARQIY